MVAMGHKVSVRMTAKLDDGAKIDLGLGNNDELEFTVGAGEASAYVDSLAASMTVGEVRSWKTPAVRVLGPSMVGRDIKYEITLLADHGRVVSAIAAEHAHHEHGCACGCDRLRRSLSHA